MESIVAANYQIPSLYRASKSLKVQINNMYKGNNRSNLVKLHHHISIIDQITLIQPPPPKPPYSYALPHLRDCQYSKKNDKPDRPDNEDRNWTYSSMTPKEDIGIKVFTKIKEGVKQEGHRG